MVLECRGLCGCRRARMYASMRTLVHHMGGPCQGSCAAGCLASVHVSVSRPDRLMTRAHDFAAVHSLYGCSGHVLDIWQRSSNRWSPARRSDGRCRLYQYSVISHLHAPPGERPVVTLSSPNARRLARPGLARQGCAHLPGQHCLTHSGAPVRLRQGGAVCDLFSMLSRWGALLRTSRADEQAAASWSNGHG